MHKARKLEPFILCISWKGSMNLVLSSPSQLFSMGACREEYIYIGFSTDIIYILHTGSDRLNSE